jgi:hypothetical protein
MILARTAFTAPLPMMTRTPIQDILQASAIIARGLRQVVRVRARKTRVRMAEVLRHGASTCGRTEHAATDASQDGSCATSTAGATAARAMIRAGTAFTIMLPMETKTPIQDIIQATAIIARGHRKDLQVRAPKTQVGMAVALQDPAPTRPGQMAQVIIITEEETTEEEQAELEQQDLVKAEQEQLVQASPWTKLQLGCRWR